MRKQFIQQGTDAVLRIPAPPPLRGSADEGEGEGKGGDAMRPSRAIVVWTRKAVQALTREDLENYFMLECELTAELNEKLGSCKCHA